MSAANDRLKAALDGLIYLPSLQNGGTGQTGGSGGYGSPHNGATPTQIPGASSPAGRSSTPAGAGPVLCRPWDRNDLLRRLQTFRASMWFCKPAALGPVPCAMRGWVNCATDTLKCEVCGAKVLCEISPNSNSEEYKQLIARHAQRLDEAHTSCCPWRGNACSPWLQQFPTISRDVMLEQQALRVKALSLVDMLPEIKMSAIETMCGNQRAAIEKIMGGSAIVQAGRSKGARRESVQQLIAACGWEVQIQGFSVTLPPPSQSGDRSSPSSACVQLSTRRSLDCTGSADRHVNGGGERQAVDSHRVVLHCPMCNARVGLWNFKPGVAGPRPLWQINFLPGARSPSVADLPPTPTPTASASLTPRSAPSRSPAAPTPATPAPDVQRVLTQTIGGGDLDLLADSPSSTPALWPSRASRTIKLAATAPATPVFGANSASRAPAFGYSPTPPPPPTPAPSATPASDEGGQATTPEVPEEEVGEGDASAQRPGKRQRVQKEGAAGRQASGGFDPIALHRPFCPWVSTGVGEAKNLRCGWMRVLEALHRGSAGAAPETAALTPQVDNEQTEEGQTIEQYRRRFMTALFNP